jgi:hypothetical protein
MTTERTPADVPPPRAAEPKPLSACEARGRAYPRLAELLREPTLAGALRTAVLGGAVLSTIALSGCEPTECERTRLGEIKTHTSQALSLLGDFELKSGGTELAVGLGISPHPVPMMLGGVMMPMTPDPLPSEPPPTEPPPSGPTVPPATE